MDLISRLRRYMDAKTIAVTQFADTCGIPRPSLSQLLNGRNKKVSDEVIAKIHRGYPGLSMMWLLFGEGAMEQGLPTPYPDHSVTGSEEAIYSGNGRLPFERGDLDSFASAAPYGQRDTGGDGAQPVRRPAMAPGAPHSRPAIVDGDGPAADSADDAAAQRPAAVPSFSGISTPGKHVASIVVYYDDKSYEMFVPSSRPPFTGPER